MTLPWGLPLDRDQGPRLLSAPHDLPLLATAELLPSQYLQVSTGDVGVKPHYWEHLEKKRAASLTKALAAPWLLCPWLLP